MKKEYRQSQCQEFNLSKKNKRKINNASAYVYVSCLDFSHSNGVYTYTSVGEGVPLSLEIAKGDLESLSEEKEVKIILSDHEIHRDNLLELTSLTKERLMKKSLLSYEAIKSEGMNPVLLSDIYPYDGVLSQEQQVPEDSHLEYAISQWVKGSREERILRYKQSYAEIYCLFEYCEKNNLCPIFLYSSFLFRLVNVLKKKFTIGVLFLEIADPH